MTYCLGIALDQGLVLCTDSRTHAGPDQVATYSKMHRYHEPGERLLVVLSAGNLATTQGVLARVKQDIKERAEGHLLAIAGVGEAAEYLGELLRAQSDKHAAAAEAAGFSTEASLIVGGEVRGRTPKLYMIYPQGNYITTSEGTPFLHIGEAKYGKPILDRLVTRKSTLDQAVRCALVAMDSTMRSNATVGPPIEVLAHAAGNLGAPRHLRLAEGDPYLLALRQAWAEQLVQAFARLPRFTWQPRS